MVNRFVIKSVNHNNDMQNFCRLLFSLKTEETPSLSLWKIC